MSLGDLDAEFIKSITSLHSTEHLISGGPSVLQTLLEEAIKNKTGVCKDFTPLLAPSVKQQRLEDFSSTIAVEDSRTASSSDNELELDLLKEDLMCIVCNGMDVGARNRLLECSECYDLYHQECHRPVIVMQDFEESFVCQSCKESESRRNSDNRSSSMTNSSSSSKSLVGSKNSSGYLPRSSVSTPAVNFKSSSKTNATKLSSISSSKPPLSSFKFSNNVSARSPVTPDNMNKRIQIMKKKAAKLQEKRKLSR